ncbi:hypothetical protein FNB15_06625 [Ferrovibrio terrae]|uniref:Uncharacterized protein n=1 Tax=Ferrovibrio terrae TaxID=2594003 RepID=A0A516GZL1_9PROT|nr:hypothetical protein [Ferrovibrio terrae]QDO96966.1 hypothetical protein FNB15_06625 [Ferrovibrio terrae]
MSALAVRARPEPGAAALVVVFPGLAMLPCGMSDCTVDFRGEHIVVVNGTTREIAGMPLELRGHLRQQSQRAKVQTLYSDMFGNRRGLILPVDLAVKIVAGAGLLPDQDRILLTGCYRGWLPGSIDVLAEALAALRYHVEVDARVPRR